MSANRFKDFKNPFAPFSKVEKLPCPRAKQRCHISGDKIEKDEQVYRFKLFNYDQDTDFFAKEHAFEGSDYHENYTRRFLRNQYCIEDFANYDFIRHPDYQDVIRNFSFDKAIQLIVHPALKPRPYRYRNGEEYHSLPSAQNFKYDMNVVPLLLSILVKCGYSENLLEALSSYPSDSLLLFSLLDDLRFQERVKAILPLKILPQVFQLIRKPKNDLSDFRIFIEIGQDLENFMPLLFKALQKYELEGLSTFFVPDCFHDIFSQRKNCRLLYFFISHPELIPILKRLIDRGDFPTVETSHFLYMEAYYYRAALLHIARYRSSDLPMWIDNMQKEVEFFHSGNPKGFINETIRISKNL